MAKNVPEFEIRGLERLSLATRKLDKITTGLPQEFRKEARKALIRARYKVARSARNTLPGKLGEAVASSSVTIVTRNKQARLSVNSPYNLDTLDKGVVHHPVFGNRKVWVTQKVNPNWFTDPIKSVDTEVLVQLKLSLDRMVKNV